MPKNETILIAPLNWGLGHATRSIPIIQKLLDEGKKVVLASDGEALALLQKEFPQLPTEQLPAYGIKYPKNPMLMPFYMLRQSFGVWRSILKEKKKTREIIEKYNITQIISDNRYGVYSPQIHSIIITHQLRVLSGIFTPFTSYAQKKLLSPFDEIWVPDFAGEKNLSGKLSHDIKLNKPVKYIGPLSRLNPIDHEPDLDLLILLSGPEPQRSMLERKLIELLKETSYNIYLVQGKPAAKQETRQIRNIRISNYLLSGELENILSSARLILSRPGYTSIMDYYKLKKSLLYIPTPGQYEQEYLAKHLFTEQNIPYIPQNKLDSRLIEKIKSLLKN